MEKLTNKQKHILRQKLCDMKNRCYNPENKHYKDYGGRGITVCDEWLDKKDGHKNFWQWALESGWKENLSIDRKDVNGNYEPSNCRWATPKEQANNRRNNNYVTIHGETKTSQEWAEQIGITERAFASRIAYGWDEDRLLEPKNKPLKMTKAEMAREIKQWRNAEEQGLLLRLPCKVGDVVCVLTPKKNDYFEADVKRMVVYDNDIDIVTCICVRSIKEIGKTVFLSREEAEQALAEMKEV